MYALRKKSPIVALLLADIHLGVKVPIAREEEPSWFSAMARPWLEVNDLIRDAKKVNGAPPAVLCAGDIFDRWNSPPEMINWALEHLPTMYAIPGNHDLPNHRPELAHRSAYGTLVRAGKIIELDSVAKRIYNLDVYGQPFNEEVPIPLQSDKVVKVLVTHEYLWTTGTGFAGASEECKLSSVAKKFSGFDVVVVGDNHIGFERRLKGGTFVFNCGALIRRKASEAIHHPRVGLLKMDGTVVIHQLDTSKDKLTREVSLEQEQSEEYRGEVSDFVEGLVGLEADELSFQDAIVREMKAQKLTQPVQDILLGAMNANTKDH